MWLYTTYSIFALIYIWYRYIFLFSREKIYAPLDYDPLISIIIPTYNEQPDYLEKCIESIINADGNKEIYIIDAGSKDKTTKKILKDLKVKYPELIIHSFKENSGKRKAHEYAFKKAKGEFLVTIDSDTIVNKDAFTNLIRPFSDKKVGAITGNIKVYNRNDNIISKMISARYWSAFNFERNSLSNWCIVTCCSGPLSAYRKEYVMPILKEYSNQMFLGKECTYGDDRALTRLILKDYDIVFARNSIAYTGCPTKLKDFLKQQIRWKKSWFRETYLTTKFMWKRSKLLSWEIFITTILPFLGLFVRLSLIISFFIYPIILLYYIMTIIIMAIIRNMYMLFENPREFIYSIPYAFIHETLIFWLYPIALIQLNDTGWGTR